MKARGISSSIPTAAPSSVGLGRLRSCWRPILATRSRCREWIPTKMRPSAQQNLKDLEKFQCADGGILLLGRRLSFHVPVPHGLPAARIQDGGRPEVQGRCRHARACIWLSRTRPRGRASDERRLVAVLYGLAGVCGQGARGRWPQSGLEPHTPLRLPRADAGVRACLPARRAGSARRFVTRLGEPARRISGAAWPTRFCPRRAARTSKN